jgi:hypothetical protein
MTAAYHFPLEFAQACADCGAVSDLRRFRLCAACASANVMSLAPILNRTPITMLGAPNPFSCVEDCRAN